MKTKRPKKKGMTQKAFAEVLGISPALLNHHLKSGKAPKIGDVDEWNTYLAINSREGGLPRDIRRKIAEQRHRLIKEQATAVEHLNMERKGKVIAKDNAQSAIQSAMSLLFVELDRLFLSEAPATLKGRDEREIYAWAENALNRLRGMLRDKFKTIAG